MNIDPPKLETAEEKATRIWRNNQIIRTLANENIIPEPVVHEPEPRKFRNAIMELFKSKHNDTIMHYVAAIKHRKRILMLEKLKRMERDNAES